MCLCNIGSGLAHMRGVICSELFRQSSHGGVAAGELLPGSMSGAWKRKISKKRYTLGVYFLGVLSLFDADGID